MKNKNTSKWKRLLWTAALMAPLWLGAQTTHNAAPGTLQATMDAAADGDIILLEPGTYSEDLNFPSGTSLTLKNPETDNTQVLLTGKISLHDQTNGASLYLENLSIDPSGDYFFDGTLGDINIIAVEGVRIFGVRRCFIRANQSTALIGTLRFNNSLIYNNGEGGYNFIWTKTKVGQVKVSNSTLYNYSGGESFFSRHSAPKDSDHLFRFEMSNNTVYRWSKGSGYALCKTDDSFSAESEFIFRNNLVYQPGVEGQEPKLVSATGGKLSAQNNLVVDYGSYNLSGALSSVIDDHSLASLGLEALSFPNPDGGDFSIFSSSPLATAATDGGVLGDPRWLVTASNTYELVQGLAAQSAPNAGSVTGPSGDLPADSEVSLTATHNFGFRFHSWVNGQGEELSTDNPYRFNLEADAVVKAVFNAIPIYTLDLQRQGAGEYGAVQISPPGENGGFERYEQGTQITLTAQSNAVILFSDWDGQETDPVKTLTMDGDKTVTANFYTADYIAGWDFKGGASQSRPADYYSRPENIPALGMYSSTDNQLYQSFWLRNEDGRDVAAIWKVRDSAEQFYYFETSFSTIGHGDLKVHYSLMGKYYGNSQWLLQYAINDGDYQTAASTDINTSSFSDARVTIAGTGGQDKVTLRLLPNTESPTHGNIADVDGTYLSDFFILADAVAVDDQSAPELRSTLPSHNATQVSARAKVILTFNEAVKEGTGDWQINDANISEVLFAGQKVSFSLSGLAYNTSYTLTLPEGAISDLSDNAFTGTTLSFTTMQRPEVAAKGFDFLVDPQATPVPGQVGNTIAEAFAAVPENNPTRFHILVKNGTYNEILELPANKPRVSLIGESRDGVIVTGKREGISNPVVKISAADFYCENFTFENTLGLTNGVGVAINTGGERTAYKNVRMLGGQDTQVTSGTRHYFENCAIHGTVDFICGDGDVFFESCLLYLEERGNANVIVAASTQAQQNYGYVFSNCTIDGSPTSNEGQYSLGRPWKNAPRAVFINTEMLLTPQARGWTNMSALAPALYAEYGSYNKHGLPIDLSTRTNQFERDGVVYTGDYDPQLSSEEAATYSVENVLTGGDAWRPKQATEAVAAPLLTATDGNLSWQPVDYAMCYVVLKDNAILGWTTETSFDTEGPGSYSLKAVSAYGGLSAASEALEVEADGTTSLTDLPATAQALVTGGTGFIHILNIHEATTLHIYSLSGQLLRVQSLAEPTSSALPAGFYVVRLQNSRQTQSHKVIVK